MDPKYRSGVMLLLCWVIGVTGLALAGYANFTLRQENTALRKEIATLANMKSPVNCPSYDWFTGKGL